MTATIFTPADDSLQARIQAWKKVRQANDQLKNSLNLNNAEWQDRLGEQADRLFAQETIANSYQQAAQSISAQELQTAKASGLLSESEVRDLVIAHRAAQSQQRSEQLAQQQRQRKR